jgi:hypothetical protein
MMAQVSKGAEKMRDLRRTEKRYEARQTQLSKTQPLFVFQRLSFMSMSNTSVSSG